MQTETEPEIEFSSSFFFFVYRPLMYSVHRVKRKLLQFVHTFVYYTRGCGCEYTFLGFSWQQKGTFLAFIESAKVYNTYVHLEFKSEKIGGHSSEAANQVEPLCAPPKTPDQLSTHLKKSSSASSASAASASASASTSSQQFHRHHHQHQ